MSSSDPYQSQFLLLHNLVWHACLQEAQSFLCLILRVYPSRPRGADSWPNECPSRLLFFLSKPKTQCAPWRLEDSTEPSWTVAPGCDALLTQTPGALPSETWPSADISWPGHVLVAQWPSAPSLLLLKVNLRQDCHLLTPAKPNSSGCNDAVRHIADPSPGYACSSLCRGDKRHLHQVWPSLTPFHLFWFTQALPWGPSLPLDGCVGSIATNESRPGFTFPSWLLHLSFPILTVNYLSGIVFPVA